MKNGGNYYNIETPAGISGVKYTISYTTKLTDEAVQKEKENPHQVFSYNNVARVVDQGDNTIKGDATATVGHQYKYFTKTDTSPETLTADIIEYQIVINPDALTLNGGNDLTLTDTLPEGTQFISNGYNFNPEGSCKTLGLDSGTRKLTVVVPDSQSITFTYKLKSDNLYPDWSGHVFTNYAELSGTGKQVINVERKHIIRKHSGNITGSTSSIHIHKYDQDDMASSLYGAEFKLYRLKVEADGTLTQDGGAAVATETTDNDGNLTFENLTPVNNNSTAAPYYAYKFVETKAPDGYEINEAYNAEHGHYFIFYTDAATKANDVKAQIEAKNTGIKVEVVSGAHTFEVSNKSVPETGSLKFTKSFSGVTKDQLENLTFTVKNVTDSSNPKTIGTYTLADMTPKSGETKVYEKTLTVEPGKYEVTESSTGVTGYTLNTTTSVTSGSVSIAKDESKVIDLKNDYDENKHPVVISKTTAGGSELEGAVLELTDATGALVDKWTSTTIARTFELKPGTYKFHEVSAPSGYLVADDITFTVAIDGTITVDGKTVDKVVMIDGKKPAETTVPETTPAETTPSGGGGGGGNHPHPLPETTPAETTPAETTVPETTPVETTNPGGGHGGPSEEVETDEYGRVRGANRGKNKKGQDGGNVKGANRGKTRTGDESMMSIFGFGFLAAVLVLLGWFGIRFTKRNRR